MLAALARAWGVRDVAEHPSVGDDLDALVDAFWARPSRERDVLLITGGVSAGIHDLVPAALLRVGVEPVFHKVAVKPGKPLWFGVGPRRADGRPGTLVFGLPGNPASGVVGFLLFVQPALDALAGREKRPTPIEPGPRGSFSHRGDRPTFHPSGSSEGESSRCPGPARPTSGPSPSPTASPRSRRATMSITPAIRSAGSRSLEPRSVPGSKLSRPDLLERWPAGIDSSAPATRVSAVVAA